MRNEDIVYRMMSDLDDMIKTHYQDVFLAALNAAPAINDQHRQEQCMVLLEAQRKHFADTLRQDAQRLTAILKK